MSSIDIPHRRNTYWAIDWPDAIAFAQSLPTGTKFRAFLAWNHSYHDAHYDLGILYGPAVRHPMTIEDLKKRQARAEAARLARWELSRKAQ